MVLHGRRSALQCLGKLSLSIMATSGCATILYPERRGNTRGRIDPGPLILDILWFIPGIIPGVIALAVDFASGAIYVSETVTVERGEQRTRLGLRPGEHIVVQPPRIATATAVELRLVTDAGEVLDAAARQWGTGPMDPIDLCAPMDPALRGREGALELLVHREQNVRTIRQPLIYGALTSEGLRAADGASSPAPADV